MKSAILMRVYIYAAGGLVATMAGCLIVDSGGPVLRTTGTIVSTKFNEGMTTTTYIKAGDVDVPVQTQVPGSWTAEVDTVALGKVSVPLDTEKQHTGQRVVLSYHVGKLSGDVSILSLRLESDTVAGIDQEK